MPGIAQQLGRINAKTALSYMRRIISTIDKTGKSVVGPRKLHTTHWGVICPSETPDGEHIGISKNLALTAYITNHAPPEPVISSLMSAGICKLECVNVVDLAQTTKVFVNGEWIGIVNNPHEVVTKLRYERRNGIIHIHTAIVWTIAYREINIFTDGGRLVRPLYIVEDNNLLVTLNQFKRLSEAKITWQHLLGVGDVTTREIALEQEETGVGRTDRWQSQKEKEASNSEKRFGLG